LVDIQIPKHLRLMAPFIIAKHQFTRSLTTHAPNQGEFTTDRCLENLPVLSTDPVRRAVQWTIFQDHPQMISGGPTVGFVRAAFEAVKEFKNPATPQSITIPTWFALAGEEAVNDNEAAITFANHMPDASISVYENAQHQIHMERDTIRDPFYRDLGCFIKKHLP
jgi:lysophospholipase